MRKQLYRYISCMGILSFLLLAALCPAQDSPTEESPTGTEQKTPELSHAELIRALCSDDRDEQQNAIKIIGEVGDSYALPALAALRQGSLYLWTDEEGNQHPVIGGDPVTDESGFGFTVDLYEAETNKPILDKSGKQIVVKQDTLEKAKTNNRLRREIRPILNRLSLMSPDPETRKGAAVKLGMEQDPENLALFEEALAREKDSWTRHALEESIWITQLKNEDPYVRRYAAEKLAGIHAPNGLIYMETMLASVEGAEPIEQDPQVAATIQNSIEDIHHYQRMTQLLGTGFYGLSLGAVLTMIALGLAITFGLMGVINMAHGEFMLIGAYTAFVVQTIFQKYLPAEYFDFYFISALPLAFLSAGLVGLLLEAGVIRFLYGRPLETLLLTWGISLILQQAARHIFGAANVDVASPSWLNGGVQVMVGLVLPYNRLFIIIFSLICVLGTYIVLFRSPLGLRIRAVTQNRNMSACLGVPTRRVDAWTFAIGAGIAGMAGWALSLLGNVGPDLGQTYIVDAFMVVVLGGVGKLAGTIAAGLGIGTVSKIIEPFADAVMGKVIVLAILILFLQWRPGGLFPAKGRHAEI